MQNRIVKRISIIFISFFIVIFVVMFDSERCYAYTEHINQCGERTIKEVDSAASSGKISQTWIYRINGIDQAYSGGEVRTVSIPPYDKAYNKPENKNPNPGGEVGVAAYVLGVYNNAPGLFVDKRTEQEKILDDEDYKNFIEQILLNIGVCASYTEQFRENGIIHLNYQLPAQYINTPQLRLLYDNKCRITSIIPYQANVTTVKMDTFDAIFYSNMYPDVKTIAGDDYAKVYNHYLTYGIKEGRYPNAIAYNAAQKANK